MRIPNIFRVGRINPLNRRKGKETPGMGMVFFTNPKTRKTEIHPNRRIYGPKNPKETKK